MRRVKYERAVAVKRFAAHEREQCEVEAAVARLAATRGLGPRVLAASETELRTERIGKPYRGELHALAHALAKLHALPPPPLAAYRHVPQSFVRYARAANAPWLLPHVRGLEQGEEAPRVLCHGDIKASNLRVVRGRVVFIDFEAARLADPAWELANAAIGLMLSPREEDELVTTYCLHARRDPVTTFIRFHAWRLIGLVYFADEVPQRARLGQSMRARVPVLRRRARTVRQLLRSEGRSESAACSQLRSP